MKKFIKLTCFDNTPVVINLDEVYLFETITRMEIPFVQISFIEGNSVIVKENCDLIYMMINS